MGAYGPAHLTLGLGYLFQPQYEQAITEMEQAIAVDSSDAGGYAILAWALSWAGKSAEALQMASGSAASGSPRSWTFI